MGDTKFGALVLIIVLGAIVALGPAALAEGAVVVAVTDESITVDYDREVSVNESGLEYNESVTITNDGTTLQEGADYEWNATTGNVTWYNTTSTSEGDEAQIDYEYEAVTEESQQLAQLISIFEIPLALLVLLLLGMSTVKAVNG